ncbi:MAG: ankyrin repeat domain-containing protein [Candidatus Thorarchaeota archaeon]
MPSLVMIMDDNDEMLLLAAGIGNLDGVRVAIIAGANINIQSESFSESALHLASSKGYLEIVEFLVDNGADMLLKNGVDMTPIHLAARDGQTRIVEFLLQKVGKISERILSDIMSVANMSVTGRPEISEILRKFRLKQVTPSTGGMDKANAMLLQAAESGDFTKVKEALESGADVEKTDSRGMSAMAWAGLRGHFDIVRILVEKGADVNGTNSAEWTPIMQASMGGHLEIVRFLLENGAKVNLKTFVSGTALIFASVKGRIEIVKILLENGADPTIMIDEGDDYGMTAWAYARKFGHSTIASLLEEATKKWNK